MIQGTGSEVGKSLLAAGLCRAFRNRHLNVRPFKPQNMSNNAAVTADGGEIGRAQALQARACGVKTSFHMNPVLMKPQSEKGAQLIVQGQRMGDTDARAFTDIKHNLLGKVVESFEIVGSDADLVIVEGAGSPAEINLRAGDIANMGFALSQNVPVILVADIERGGVIANVIGTYELLDELERKQIAGYVINKFRGDISLFDDGVAEITRRTGWPCLGVLPYLATVNRLPAEDAVRLQDNVSKPGNGCIKVAVPVLPRIANFDDLDPLIAEPDVEVEFVKACFPLPGDADFIILPGSKSTRADLDMIRKQGWDIDIAAHVRRGGWVLGLCGGYQMLGRTISDPEGLEGPAGTSEGLGYLDVQTILEPHKAQLLVKGSAVDGGAAIEGYEIHMGRTRGPDTTRPMLEVEKQPAGAVSADGKIMGCYIHGLFNADEFRMQFLEKLSGRKSSGIAFERMVDETLDELASHLEEHLEIGRLWQLMNDWVLPSHEQKSKRRNA
ncbi:cobyric acid synthase [Alphaproteobacteria bacterium]|nr:cobyric acid synthase [Alphaproteobacteria bacterium]